MILFPSEGAFESELTSIRPNNYQQNLLIYIAGHGTSTPTGIGSFGSVSMGRKSSIDEVNVKRILHEIAPRFNQIAIIVDSCHSGSWFE